MAVTETSLFRALARFPTPLIIATISITSIASNIAAITTKINRPSHPSNHSTSINTNTSAASTTCACTTSRIFTHFLPMTSLPPTLPLTLHNPSTTR